MPDEKPEFDISVIETYFGVPIVEVCCVAPTILTAATDLRLARTLLDLPYPEFAVVINYRNMSHASDYGPEEQVAARREEPFRSLQRRIIILVRFHAVSFTAMIQTLRTSALLRQSLHTSFVPDFDSAVRAARRAIDAASASLPKSAEQTLDRAAPAGR